MNGGKPKAASEQWMRNALASGSIVPPPGEPDPRSRALGRVWAVCFTAGVVALFVAAAIFWRG